MDSKNDVIFDMKSMLKRFNIDSDQWVGKSFREKLEYLKKRMKAADKIELAESGSKLLDALFFTLKTSTSNRVARSYLTLAETACNLFRIDFIVKNAFVSEQYEYHGHYDELARELGAESDYEITTCNLKTSVDMCKFLANIVADTQEKYDIRVNKVKDLLGPASDDDDDDDAYHMRLLTRFFHNSRQYVMLLESYSSSAGDKSSDREPEIDRMYSALTLATLNDDYDEDAFEETVHSIYSAYISGVDLTKYMFDMDDMFFTKCKKSNTVFDVHNLDVEHMRLAIDSTLSHGRSRGFLIEGEPGVGKTISVEKVIEGLPQYPIFWVPLTALGPDCIDQTFDTLSRVDKSIIIFDDIDGLDMGKKDVYSTDFISRIDDLRDGIGGHVIIIIVNEPQKLHNMFRMRPGRIDEVIVVTAPRNPDEVFDVIKQRFTIAGEPLPEWASLDNSEFAGMCRMLSDKGITQAYISGIVDDLLLFYEGDCTIGNFEKTVNHAMDSRENSMLVAGADGRLCSAQNVQRTDPPGPGK